MDSGFNVIVPLFVISCVRGGSLVDAVTTHGPGPTDGFLPEPTPPTAPGPEATELDLHDKLFARYNPDVMPIRNISKSISVSIQLFLLSFDNLDEKQQTFTTRLFLELRWKDEFLVWNASDYGGVKTINVQNENIWFPDLALDNTFDKPTEMGQEDDRSIVDADGNVVTWPYKTFTVTCRIKIKKFPFDEQVCQFDFLSWTHPVSKLYLSVPEEGIQLYKYAESGEWELTKHEMIHFQNPFGDDAWDHVIFKLTLTRKWMFYTMNMLGPLICISLLNLLCFILPAESGEKISLAISIFLTLAVFLTIVSSEQPESSDEMSILGLYIGLQLLGSGLTIVTTVATLYMYHVDPETPVPLVFRALARVCCMTAKPHKYDVDAAANGDVVQEISATSTADILFSENGETLSNGKLSKQGHEQPWSYKHKSKVTWEMVSRAFDRLCLVMGLVFQVGLTTVAFVLLLV